MWGQIVTFPRLQCNLRARVVRVKKPFQNSFSKYLYKYSIYFFITFVQNNVFWNVFLFFSWKKLYFFRLLLNFCCKTINDDISFPEICLNFSNKIIYWIFFEIIFGWKIFLKFFRKCELIFFKILKFFSKTFFEKYFSKKIFETYFFDQSYWFFFQKNKWKFFLKVIIFIFSKKTLNFLHYHFFWK